jgi:hypothetical protein
VLVPPFIDQRSDHLRTLPTEFQYTDAFERNTARAICCEELSCDATTNFPHTWLARFVELGKITQALPHLSARQLTALWMFGWGPISDFVEAQKSDIASEITAICGLSWRC